MGGMKRTYSKDKAQGHSAHKAHGRAPAEQGPSQRQLRAGELVRHALVEILREEDIHDDDLHGVSITVTEVRCSPDLRHATVFVEPLGAGLGGVTITADEVGPAVAALNRHAKFLRGILGRMIERPPGGAVGVEPKALLICGILVRMSLALVAPVALIFSADIETTCVPTGATPRSWVPVTMIS